MNLRSVPPKIAVWTVACFAAALLGTLLATGALTEEDPNAGLIVSRLADGERVELKPGELYQFHFNVPREGRFTLDAVEAEEGRFDFCLKEADGWADYARARPDRLDGRYCVFSSPEAAHDASLAVGEYYVGFACRNARDPCTIEYSATLTFRATPRSS